jgi:hypothetical protein
MQENDFSIHAPNSMGVIKGQSTTADITIERTGEHNQEISLSLWTTIPIPGLNPSYEPNTIPGDESFSQLTITTNHYTIPGTFNVAVLGNDGVNNRFVYFTLYINEPFDLSLPQESVSIAQGDSVFVDVNISNKVGGWNSQVAMTVENDIIGQGESLVDTAFSPNPIPWDESSSRLKLVVGNAVPPGSYPLTITGTIPTEYRTAELQLTVIEGKSY